MYNYHNFLISSFEEFNLSFNNDIDRNLVLNIFIEYIQHNDIDYIVDNITNKLITSCDKKEFKDIIKNIIIKNKSEIT